MLTDEELQKVISKVFLYKNTNAKALRANIKAITGKNVTLRRLMRILNENNYCIEII